MDGALYLLLGRTRASVLKALHDALAESLPLHLREIARRAAASPTAVQYELRMLSQLDLVKDVGTLSRPLYVLNRDHRLHPGLHALFSQAQQAEQSAAQGADDAHFRSKRKQQRQDHRAKPRDNSAFLRRWKTLSDKVKVL
jgi:hypothetical protein